MKGMDIYMINKMKKIFKRYMVHPLIYQVITKMVVVVVIALLWDRFVNVNGHLSMVRDAYFVLGLIFLMLSWFQYLRLDGVSVKHLFGTGEKRKTKRNGTSDIADYADEKIISFSELEDEERTVVRLLSDVLTGLIFVIISLVALVVL